MQTDSAVIDVDVTNFQTDVVERSRKTPVLLDLWATWCGPCKTLGPILEKLAREMKGRFVLAKVDIDRNPEIADALQVQSVPTVMLLKDGRIADGFTGALPEAQIRKFLDVHLGAPAPDAFAQAQTLEAQGKRAEAAAALQKHLQAKPEHGEARLMLARLLVAEGRAEEARKVFAKLSGELAQSPEALALAAQFEAAQKPSESARFAQDVERAPKDVAARIALGKTLVAEQRYDDGLEQLLTAAKLDLKFEDGAPRKALIEVFNLLGQSDPRVLEYQRRLSMLLCV
jgi:putative thioredoxin